MLRITGVRSGHSALERNRTRQRTRWGRRGARAVTKAKPKARGSHAAGGPRDDTGRGTTRAARLADGLRGADRSGRSCHRPSDASLAKPQVSGTVSKNTPRSARGSTEARARVAGAGQSRSPRPDGGARAGRVRARTFVAGSRGPPGACIVAGSSCCHRTSGRLQLPAGGFL